jgi:hypothetical protein
VKNVGSKGYSQLFFFASLAALLYYLYFAFRGHKDKEPYNVYRGVLFLAFFASVGCFLEPQSPALHAWNELLLYCFVVSVMTVDLIGTTLGPIVLQSSVNPVIFRQVYQKIVAVELTARITASGVVWLLSQTHQMTLLYPFAWLLLAAHFYLFGVTVWRMRIAQSKAKVIGEGEPPAMENVKKSVKFIFNNPLVRVAMLVMIWSTVTKFVLENIFYQVTDKTFSSAPQLASFISALTIVIYALSLMLHPLITRLLNARLHLNTLLSIQPLNILAFGGLALILPPFWPLVLLMVTYNIIHRSIQMPMSRQCLVPVPRNNKGTIVSLISIFIAVSTMLTSGVMALLKDSLHFEDYVVFLLVLGTGILFMVTSLDSYYIRNLWSLFKEIRSGQWQDEQIDDLSMSALEPAADAIAPTSIDSSDLSSHPTIEAYASSFDHSKLEIATRDHIALLNSNETESQLSGLKICYVTDFPWLREALSDAVNSDNKNISQFAGKAEMVNNDFQGMFEYSSLFRRRVKSLALELLEQNEHAHYNALKNLRNCQNVAAAESLVASLNNRRFKQMRSLMFDCVSHDGKTLSVKPIYDQMYQRNFHSSLAHRELLDSLPFGKLTNDLRETIAENLMVLKQDNVSFERNPNQSKSQNIDLFMHTLFLEEYRLSAGHIDKTLTESISEFSILSHEESGILIDMHLSFLKRSELFAAWESILTVLEPSVIR